MIDKKITAQEEKQLKTLIDLAYTIKVIDSISNCESLGSLDDEIIKALKRSCKAETELIDSTLGRVDWTQVTETVRVTESVLDWPWVRGRWKKALTWSAVKNLGYAVASSVIIFLLFLIGEIIILFTDFVFQNISTGLVAAILFSFVSSTLTGNFQKRAYKVMPSWSERFLCEHIKDIKINLNISKQAKKVEKEENYGTRH